MGTITGAVVDTSGASIAHAQVKPSLDNGGPHQTTQSGRGGDFSFSGVAPGPFHLFFAAEGFSRTTIAGELQAGETLNFPQTALAVATITTEVNVTATRSEIAAEQIKQEETQRFGGLVPNYFVTYNPNAAPLNTKQKFDLTWKSFLDPSTFVINGAIAGVWQARNIYRGFGQGAQGYGKRYGAAFADYGTSLVIEKLVVLSELVVIDPQKQAVIKRYPLAPGTGPTGLALDAANRRLFSTCSRKLIVLNADTGAIVSVLPIGALTDGVGYDASLRRVYTANGIGSMTVIQQDSPDRYRVLEYAPTRFGGHSLIVDPATHRILVAAFGTIAAYEPVSRP